MGSAPLPLFERVILAPVRGRAYSGPAALPLLTHVIDLRILAVHLAFRHQYACQILELDKIFTVFLIER